MDIKQIQELVKLINKTNIGEITIEEEGVKITVKQKKDPVQHIIAGGQQAPMFSAPAAPSPAAPAPVTPAPAVAAAPKTDNYLTIKSPMIGTFYRQSGPGKPIFASEGDEVSPGSIVCIIEAMKLLNEIESEQAGVIKQILCENGQGVEFDQPLFIIA